MVDFRDVAGALASGFNQMRLRPDPGLDARLQTILQQRTAKRAKNKTVEYLRGLGTDMANQLAGMVESGALTGQQAYAQVLQLQSEERSFNRQKDLEQYKAGLTTAKVPTSIQEYEKAISGGYKGSYVDFLAFQKSKAPTVSVSYGGEGGPPKAFETLDKEFAKDAVKWSSGGAADASKNINQIRDVITDINLATSQGRTTSGPLVGVQNDLVQSFLNPEATDIRNRVQEVVQRNLREILGAQFTQAEGLALIERAYNQRLSPEMNLKRLNALLEQMATSATAKQQMYEHFMSEGTLFGYRAEATLPTLDELHGLMDTFDQQDGIDTSDILKEAKKKKDAYDFSTADTLVGLD